MPGLPKHDKIPGRFKKTIQYLADKNYDKASKEMLDSRWARQTPNRAIELSNVVKAQSNE